MKTKTSKISKIILECENCRKNIENKNFVFQYTTKKNIQKIFNNLVLKKYCKFCSSHQIFNEKK